MDRLDMYNQLPESLKPLYEGTDDRLDILDTLVNKHNFEASQKRTLIQVFGDTVLGKFSSSQFTIELSNNFEETVVSDISNELLPLLQFIDAHRNDSVVKTDEDTIQVTEQEPEPIDRQIDSPQQTTHVSPMRTMATDIEKIHGYGTRVAETDGQTPAADTTAQEAAEPIYTSSQDMALNRSVPQEEAVQTPAEATDTSAAATITESSDTALATPVPVATPVATDTHPREPRSAQPTEELADLPPPPITTPPPAPTQNPPATAGAMPSFTPQMHSAPAPADVPPPPSPADTENRWSNT